MVFGESVSTRQMRLNGFARWERLLPAKTTVQKEIIRTLLYFDIWSFPLSADEIHRFLGARISSPALFEHHLRYAERSGVIDQHDGLYVVRGRPSSWVARRRRNERRAAWMWRGARIAVAIIKCFPFVRAIFVSGELSNNVSSKGGDVDFFVVTEPGRLWIARTLLILFKKVFLLNSKKFFCLNSFVTTRNFHLEERNLYVASEVAHLKPLYNTKLLLQFWQENAWIKDFFPNFDFQDVPTIYASDRRSLLQRSFEVFGKFPRINLLDDYLMHTMEKVWEKRYPQYDQETREQLYRTTKDESRTYSGNFESKVLALYNARLPRHGVAD